MDILNGTEEMDAMQKRVQGRHETIDIRLKSLEVMEQLYCHNPTQHGYVFQAIAVLVQLSIKNADPLYNVNYKCLLQKNI